MIRTVIEVYCNMLLSDAMAEDVQLYSEHGRDLVLNEIQEFCLKYSTMMCGFMPEHIKEVEQRASFDRHCVREQQVNDFRRNLK